MVIVRGDTGLCARGTFGGDEVDADECGDTAEYEFQETGGGCRVEISIEDGRAEDDGEGKHDELGGYHLLQKSISPGMGRYS